MWATCQLIKDLFTSVKNIYKGGLAQWKGKVFLIQHFSNTDLNTKIYELLYQNSSFFVQMDNTG